MSSRVKDIYWRICLSIASVAAFFIGSRFIGGDQADIFAASGAHILNIIGIGSMDAGSVFTPKLMQAGLVITGILILWPQLFRPSAQIAAIASLFVWAPALTLFYVRHPQPGSDAGGVGMIVYYFLWWSVVAMQLVRIWLRPKFPAELLLAFLPIALFPVTHVVTVYAFAVFPGLFFLGIQPFISICWLVGSTLRAAKEGVRLH